MKITSELVKKLIATVDAGLCSGIGTPEPGNMCVEAAVCYAMALPHGDQPTCVDPAVRSFKIALNDAAWSSNEARAKGMRKLAVAQLGSAGVLDSAEFSKRVADKTIRRVLPLILRQIGLNEAADRCEKEGTGDAARAASYASDAARAASYASYASDKILIVAAELALETLVELKAPGVEWLHLCD